MIDGGYSECVNCGSQNTISYYDDRRVCENCGTDQVEYKREVMVKNLLEYGFEEVELFKPPTFFQKLFNQKPENLESFYKYGSIIANHINDSSNMKLMIGNETIIFNHYGSFKYVKGALDKIIKIKKP